MTGNVAVLEVENFIARKDYPWVGCGAGAVQDANKICFAHSLWTRMPIYL